MFALQNLLILLIGLHTCLSCSAIEDERGRNQVQNGPESKDLDSSSKTETKGTSTDFDAKSIISSEIADPSAAVDETASPPTAVYGTFLVYCRPIGRDALGLATDAREATIGCGTKDEHNDRVFVPQAHWQAMAEGANLTMLKLQNNENWDVYFSVKKQPTPTINLLAEATESDRPTYQLVPTQLTVKSRAYEAAVNLTSALTEDQPQRQVTTALLSPAYIVDAEAPIINEFVFNHAGKDDREFIEIRGTPFTDYSAYTLIIVDGDDPDIGTVTFKQSLGQTDMRGLWVTRSATEMITNPQANLMQNGAQTLLLVKDYAVATEVTDSHGITRDLADKNHNGKLALGDDAIIVDSLAISEFTDERESRNANEKLYSSTIFYQGSPRPAIFANQDTSTPTGFAPLANHYVLAGASRGSDAEGKPIWLRNNFFHFGYADMGPEAFTPDQLPYGEAVNTPGQENIWLPLSLDNKSDKAKQFSEIQP